MCKLNSVPAMVLGFLETEKKALDLTEVTAAWFWAFWPGS